MNFLRKFSNKPSLLTTAAALATAGSGILYFTSLNYDTSSSVSIPSTFWDSPLWPCGTMLEDIRRTSYVLPSHSQSDIPPLFFSRAGAFPEPDGSNVGATNAKDSPKHCSNCLGRDTIANAAAKIGPAVVHLSAPYGFYGITSGRGIGSGTIIDEDGTILTCAHVVAHSQELKSSSKGKVEVTLQDGRSFEGKVVNVDLHSDIAIVKIESKTPLPAAKLGSSSKLRPGDWVLALGCPLTLEDSVTAGKKDNLPDSFFCCFSSCVDRKSSDLGLGGMHREYLQTDCPINKGNSGGPLVNVDGEVVGVNIMTMSGADGLSFSVPIDSISKIIEHFEKKGRVVRPWLGLKMIDLNNMIITLIKERNASFPDVSTGIFVPMDSPDSPADRAGFHPGDVIVEFGGKPVGSIREVTEIMEDGIGKPFKVVVKRPNNVTVTLTVIPVEANPLH